MNLHTPNLSSAVKAAIVSLAVVMSYVQAPGCLCAPLEITVPTRTVKDAFYHQRIMPDRRRLMIALSGGGDRGLAQVGVLEILEEAGLKPDGITGVSIGALVGGLYAAGYTTSQITARLAQLDWSGILLDRPERKTLLLARKDEQARHLLSLRLGKHLTPVIPGAIAPGQKLYMSLLDLTLDIPCRTDGDWSNLRIPLQILATDLKTGRGVVFNSGDLTPGIRGSISMPLLFDPFQYDTLQLIDGGITNNIPVKLARTAENDVVLAVNTTSPLRSTAPPVQPWRIVDQVTSIMEKEADARSLDEADIVVSPQLGNIFIVEPEQVDDVVDAGRRAMETVLPDLQRLLKRPVQEDDTVFIRFSRVDFNGGASPAPPPFHEGSDLNGGAEIGEIRDYLWRLYRDGTVRNVHARYDSSNSVLSIKVIRTHRLTGVEFSGEPLIPDSILVEPFKPLLGRLLNLDTAAVALCNVLSLQRRAGFPLTTVSAVSFDTTTGKLDLKMDAGCLGGIRFVGLKKVAEGWIRHEIPLERGQPVTRQGVVKGTANLYATGLFRNVHPVLSRNRRGSGYWTLEVHVSEHPSPPVLLGLAYQSEQLTRGFIELVHPYSFYYAARTVLFTSFGKMDTEYRISTLTDKLFGLPLTYNLSMAYNMRKRTSYDSDHNSAGDYRQTRWGGSIQVGGHILTWGMLTFACRWEKHENHYPAKDEFYSLGAINARFAIDTQDRTVFPKHGIRLESMYESASDYLGSDRKFNRFLGSFDGCATAFRRHTLSLHFRGATSDRTTPSDEQFRLGGIHSFPGLHLDEKVGQMQIAGGVEYRLDLISRILAESYVGLRYDIAGSWRDPEAQITRRDWMHSSGIYLALDTMLGPVIIQWGHLFDIGPSPMQDILFIQIGNQF